jgi:aldose sugar dehydrogenase
MRSGPIHFVSIAIGAAIILAACAPDGTRANVEDPKSKMVFQSQEMARLNEPWAMTFLPGLEEALITEKGGKLLYWTQKLGTQEVSGVPKVDYGGQGGMGDVILAPDFATSGHIYLSWIEAGEKNTRGAVVGTGQLVSLKDGKWALRNLKIIWKQFPKVTGRGHYSHRMVFSPDGKYLFVASGERQKFDPAQNLDMNLGKVLRLYPDGSIPKDNPYYTEGNIVRSQIWSIGHRNILGITFDDAGLLWAQEMGPAGGDEMNLIKPKANFGYPIVSNGDHYDGRDIPDHKPGDGFNAPKVFWNPVISPSGLTYYNYALFPEWKNSLFIGGLSSTALVRVKIDGENAQKADQWDMGNRIREVEIGPDGAIWVLEDGEGARLLKLTPKN